MAYYQNFSRESVQRVACPRCGAQSGQPCNRWSRSENQYVNRKRNHEERIEIAKGE